MTTQDELLEQQIDATLKGALAAESPAIARDGFAQMARLIAMRSPEQIARMEVELGLRAP